MFRFLTAGESHGPGLTTIIEGLPAGMPISSEPIDAQLRRRQGGYGRGARQKIETDPANPAWIHSVRGFGYSFQVETESAQVDANNVTLTGSGNRPY